MTDYPVTNATPQLDAHPRLHNALAAPMDIAAQELIQQMDATGVTAVDTLMDEIYALVQPASTGFGATTLRFPAGTFRFARPSRQRQLSVNMIGMGMGKTIFYADMPHTYVNISAATYSVGTGLVSVTTSSSHGFTTGDRITVADVTDSGNRQSGGLVNAVQVQNVSNKYNGAFVITVTAPTQFTYTPVYPPVYESGDDPAGGASIGDSCPADVGTGVCGYSMFIIEDCDRPTFEGIFFKGQAAKKPVDLVYINSIGTVNGVFQTTYATLINCLFGADRYYGGDFDDENARYGFRCGGGDTGSDLIWTERCHFDSLHTAISMDQQQSIWSICQHTHIERCDYGIRTTASWHIHNPMMNRIVTCEIQVNAQAQVDVYDWNSENNAGLYFDVPHFQGSISILGKGLWLIPGTGVITRSTNNFGSVGNCHGLIKLEGQRISYAQYAGTRLALSIDGSNGLEYPSDDAIVGGVTIINCHGIEYDDLDITAGTDTHGIQVLIASDDLLVRTHLTSAVPTLGVEQTVDLEGTLGFHSGAGPWLDYSIPTPGVVKMVAEFATGDEVVLATEPTYVPTDVANLKLWFKADTNVFKDLGITAATVTGDAVEQWNDGSGGAHTLTQVTAGKRPTLKTNWQGTGHNALLFDGTNDDMITASQALSGVTSVTAFIVMDRDYTDTSSTRTPLSICGSGFGMLDLRSTVVGFDIFQLEVGNGTSVDTVDVSDLGTGTARNGPFIASFTVANAGSSAVYLNGDSKGGTTGPAALNLAAMAFNCIGADSDSISFFKGYIAEIVVYSGVLSHANYMKISHYLSRTYSISVP